MHGEHNRKPYEQMDDLGGNTHIFGGTPISFFSPFSKASYRKLTCVTDKQFANIISKALPPTGFRHLVFKQKRGQLPSLKLRANFT